MTQQECEELIRAFVTKEERVALIIDGNNLNSAARNFGISISYGRLFQLIRDHSTLITAQFYMATTALEPSAIEGEQRFLFKLEQLGYIVATEYAIRHQNQDGTVRTSGDMDVNIALACHDLAWRQMIDHLILASGDGHFRALVNDIKKHGVRTTILSTPAHASRKLINAAAQFLTLADLRPLIEMESDNVKVPPLCA